MASALIMHEIYLGIGSNIGDRRSHCERALECLAESMTVLQVSSFYETEPVGHLDQSWFLNYAIEVDTDENPTTLMTTLLNLEHDMGRHRKTPGGPRTIDIDILFYASKIVKEKNLQIPHPRLHHRRFVLEPLTEICPNFVHPVLGITVAELTAKLGAHQKVSCLRN